MNATFRRGILLFAIVSIGAALRTACLFDDFWVDEIWSWFFAMDIHSPREIFSKLLVDNNHPLNTLWMWVLGDRPRWEVYRLLSLASGVATVGMMGLLADRFGNRGFLAAAVLGCFNFLLVNYSTEARGYSPALFFSLGSVFLTLPSGKGRTWRTTLLFWGSSTLGILSHATYCFIHAGILAWALAGIAKSRSARKRPTKDFLLFHAPPALVVAAVLFWQIPQKVTGGPARDLSGIFLDLATFALGVPLEYGSHAVPVLLVAIPAFVFFAMGLSEAGKQAGPDVSIFFLCALFLVPAAMLILLRPIFVHARYFLVCVPFFLVLMGIGLEKAARKGVSGKAVCVVLTLLYCIGSLSHVRGLHITGRGNYSAAMRYMASHTAGDEIAIGGSHDFRTKPVVLFHSRYLPKDKQVVYRENSGARPEVKPEWIIRNVMDPSSRTPQPASFRFPNGSVYRLEETFPFYGVSGVAWLVYHRLPEGEPEPEGTVEILFR